MELLITTTHIATGSTNQDYAMSMTDVRYCARAALRAAVAENKFHPSAIPAVDDINLDAFRLELEYQRDSQATPDLFDMSAQQLERLFHLELPQDGALGAAITEYSSHAENWLTLLENGYYITTPESEVDAAICDQVGALPAWLKVCATIDYDKALRMLEIKHTRIDSGKIVIFSSM